MSFVASISAWLTEHWGPDSVKQFFYGAQLGFGLFFVFVFWRLRPGRIAQDSGFAVREADLLAQRKKTGAPGAAGAGDLAQARLQRTVPLALEGIRIDAPPHEVLGVAPGASPEEIQKAYRERMKQYHPDKIGRPGSREWQDAQKIAEAINRAKDSLLKGRRQ